MKDTQDRTNQEVDATIQVGCRFWPDEVEWAKRSTGALSNGTAIACYVRKKMQQEGFVHEQAR